MSLHVFANIVTPFGTASNNRGENEGNITTLQKLIWQGESHSSVSAEAIRFSLRRLLADLDQKKTNRRWDEDSRVNAWQEPDFKSWSKKDAETFIDDDLLGFMSPDAAREEGGRRAIVRRGVLEITRAVSLTPWPGDMVFNAASPGASPSAQKKGNNPAPYSAEIHATRYQYGIALTPERLREKSRATKALRALGNLCTVAGNHARFLYDFSPESIIIRITDDPAPRILYCFETPDNGKTVAVPEILRKLDAEDLKAEEIIAGGAMVGTLRETLQGTDYGEAVTLFDGVKGALDEACTRINAKLGIKE